MRPTPGQCITCVGKLPLQSVRYRSYTTALQSQRIVTAHCPSKQLLPFGFVWHTSSSSPICAWQGQRQSRGAECTIYYDILSWQHGRKKWRSQQARGRRLRRRPNINPTLDERLVLAGIRIIGRQHSLNCLLHSSYQGYPRKDHFATIFVRPPPPPQTEHGSLF